MELRTEGSVTRRLRAVVLVAVLASAPLPPPLSACTGDCNADRLVTVDELLRGVNIALGNQPLEACPGLDRNVDGGVSVAELVAAVNRALQGCAELLLSLSSVARADPLNPALLGHYDLSGALFGYDEVPGLREAMEAVGFAEWRVGLGRWELGTRLLPTLSDGTPCPPFPVAEAAAPPGSSDLDLLAAREWFVDTGQPATVADTEDDARYALAYLRSVIDTARRFGADPFVSIDLMPRALATNRRLLRRDCGASFTNRVANVPPADPTVFAAAVRGMVRRVLEGGDGEPGRLVRYWELWNEPELALFWDPDFDPDLQRFAEMAVRTLTALDGYRQVSDAAQASELRFGLGSFAHAETAAAFLRSLDANLLPDSRPVPLDFVSFHSYNDDPAEILADIRLVAQAVSETRHYQNVEIVLAEWGPSLTHTADAAYAASMDPALLVATVIAGGASLGLDRAHQALFWDYYDILTFGLLDHAVQPRPLYRAYELLHALIGDGATRLAVTEEDQDPDGEPVAALAAEDDDGRVRVLVVNRATSRRTVEIEWQGVSRRPERVLVFDDPTRGVRAQTPAPVLEVPARALVLADLGVP